MYRKKGLTSRAALKVAKLPSKVRLKVRSQKGKRSRQRRPPKAPRLTSAMETQKMTPCCRKRWRPIRRSRSSSSFPRRSRTWAWRRAGPSQHEHHCLCGATAGRSWSRRADKLLVATSIHEACGLRDACAAAAAPLSKCEQQWRGPGSGTGQRGESLPKPLLAARRGTFSNTKNIGRAAISAPSRLTLTIEGNGLFKKVCFSQITLTRRPFEAK